MRDKGFDKIINDIKYKNLTVLWFTLKRLIFSKMNIGVILLVLIPMLISSLWASGYLQDEDEMAEYEQRQEDVIFQPNDFDNVYYEDYAAGADITIENEEILYDDDENTFSIELEGESSDQIDGMHVDIILIYYQQDIEQIKNGLRQLDEEFTDYMRSLYEGNPIDNNDFNEPPPEFENDIAPDLYFDWDKSREDAGNWTDCYNYFWGFEDFHRWEEGTEYFEIKISRTNVLPHLFQTGSGLFQFGTINLSCDYKDNVWDWSEWNLNLEIGNLDFFYYKDPENGTTRFFPQESFYEIEQSRLFWPHQVIIYINGYNFPGDVIDPYGRELVDQVVYSVIVDKPLDYKSGEEEVEEEEEEPPGHILFINPISYLYFYFIVPMVVLLYISFAVADDRENRTITYLISRPISKTNILMSKYFSSFLAALIIIIPSMIITYFIMAASHEGMGSAIDNISILGIYIGLLILAVFMFGAVFMFFASISRYPLVFGLIYIFFYDLVISLQSVSLNRITINYYLTSIAHHNLKDYITLYIYKPADSWEAGAILIGALIVICILSIIFYNRRDYH
ncbi:MAG: ABC transporter permease [Thermoplasmata archaeon]|nr:MAG: ABC transporter permease [Thermoplasmata archaeon]